MANLHLPDELLLLLIEVIFGSETWENSELVKLREISSLFNDAVVRNLSGRDSGLLHGAAAGNNPGLIAKLAKDPRNRLSYTGFSPLSIAVSNNYLECVLVLLTTGASVKTPDATKWLPLYYSVTGDFPEVTALLLDHGASRMISRRHACFHFASCGLLEAACEAGSGKVVNLLLDRGFHIEGLDTDPLAERSLLVKACEKWHENVAKVLLERGASVKALETRGRTIPPLVAAARNGLQSTVELLLDKGADLNETIPGECDPQSALAAAVQYGHITIVKLILDRIQGYQHIKTPDKDRIHILAATTPNIRQLEISRCLLEFGIQSDLPDRFDQTALMLQAELGNLDGVQLLVGYGADWNAKDYIGLTALHRAIFMNEEAVVAYLIEKGADLGDETTNLAPTALQVAFHRQFLFNAFESHYTRYRSQGHNVRNCMKRSLNIIRSIMNKWKGPTKLGFDEQKVIDMVLRGPDLRELSSKFEKKLSKNSEYMVASFQPKKRSRVKGASNRALELS